MPPTWSRPSLPPLRRSGLRESALAALVVAAAWWHLRGQAGLAATYNEMYGLFAACLPLPPRDTLTLTVGHLTEAVLQIAAAWISPGVCDFSGLSARWPSLLATLLALPAAAWLDRANRSWAERLLTVVLLTTSSHPLAYGHYGRPYSWLILGGLVIWILRHHTGFCGLRALAGTTSVLSLPMAGPLWMTILAVEGRHRSADRRGLALEALFALTAIAIAVSVLTGPVAPYIENLGYTLSAQGGWHFNCERIALLWSLPWQEPWVAPVIAVVWVGFALAGCLRRPVDGAILALAAGIQATAWWWFKLPGWPRYLLPLVMATPSLAAAGLPRVRSLRVGVLGLSAVGAILSQLFIHRAGPRIFLNLEVHPTPAEIAQLLGERGILVVDGAFFTDSLVFPLAATGAHEIVVVGEPTTWWPTPPGPLSLHLAAFRASRGVTAAVRYYPSPSDLPWSTFAESGRRVVVAGAPSLHRKGCTEFCTDTFTERPQALRVIRASEWPENRQAACPRDQRMVIVVEPGDSPAPVLLGLLHRETLAFVDRWCGP